MSGPDQQLLLRAREARERSHAPVSRYRVGAALLCDDGQVVTGCNVENIVLAETVCAEKVALVKAISDGRTTFEAVAVFTDDDPPASPCGSCRQMLHTWGVRRVVVGNVEGDVRVYTIDELLPHAFHLLPEGPR